MRSIRFVVTLALSLGVISALGIDRSAAQNIYYLNPQWVPYGGGPLPPPVISGGFERGHSFPICRAFAMGLQIPGSSSTGTAMSAMAGPASSSTRPSRC